MEMWDIFPFIFDLNINKYYTFICLPLNKESFKAFDFSLASTELNSMYAYLMS